MGKKPSDQAFWERLVAAWWRRDSTQKIVEDMRWACNRWGKHFVPRMERGLGRPVDGWRATQAEMPQETGEARTARAPRLAAQLGNSHFAHLARARNRSSANLAFGQRDDSGNVPNAPPCTAWKRA